MKKKRIIPVLLLKNGWLVQSINFKSFKPLGNPIWAVKRFSEWASDELIYLDISRDDNNYDLRRDDLKDPNRHNILEILEDVSKCTFMPITVGGKIRSLQDIEDRLSRGADKVSINTKALEDRKFIAEAAKEFGSQCIVVSVDTKKINGKDIVMKTNGTVSTGYDALEWVKMVETEGAGEILLNSIDRDGAKEGYDIPLLKKVSSAIKIPVIALGGAGECEHFAEAFDQTDVDAVAAANMFQHVDQSVYLAKKSLFDNNYCVRNPDLFSLTNLL